MRRDDSTACVGIMTVNDSPAGTILCHDADCANADCAATIKIAALLINLIDRKVVLSMRVKTVKVLDSSDAPPRASTFRPSCKSKNELAANPAPDRCRSSSRERRRRRLRESDGA